MNCSRCHEPLPGNFVSSLCLACINKANKEALRELQMRLLPRVVSGKEPLVTRKGTGGIRHIQMFHCKTAFCGEELDGATGTVRIAFERRATATTCAACCAQLNAIVAEMHTVDVA